MPKYPVGQMLIIDDLQRKLDSIETTWPMTGSYERVDPYIIPYLHGGDYFQLLIYHIESKLWFDNTNADPLVSHMVQHKLIAEGDTVFDLGCNAGAITLVMARLTGPNGHVHAFDPYPWNAAATKANAQLNYFRNVTSYPVGLSNRDYLIQVSPNDSRIYQDDAASNSQQLRIEAIANYMHLKPKFLKIDIEGAEHDLFENPDPRVFASVQAFALEFHPFWIRPRGLDPKMALANMEKAGFSLHYYSAFSHPYAIESFDDDHHMFWGKRRAA